jgi:hypothetical protein
MVIICWQQFPTYYVCVIRVYYNELRRMRIYPHKQNQSVLLL